MKASDYDLLSSIAPVGPTSMTPRLSCLWIGVQVVEAGKTNRDLAKRAAAVLGEAQPNVSVIVNKCQTYLPAGCSRNSDLPASF